MAKTEDESEIELLSRAKNIMASSSKLQGSDYFKSGLKRKLDVVIASFGLTASSPIIALAAAAVYFQDRNAPFFDNASENPATGKCLSFWKIRTILWYLMLLAKKNILYSKVCSIKINCWEGTCG